MLRFILSTVIKNLLLTLFCISLRVINSMHSLNKAIECFRILVRVETEMFETLDDVLNNYFAAMIEEQRLKARKRIDWLLVDERVRVDTTNLKFWGKLENQTDNSSLNLGFDEQKTKHYYIELMKEYFPIAERRYIDNVARAVTTHIFDVPMGGTRSEVRSDMSFKYPSSARNILKDDGFDQAMKVKNGLSEEKIMLEKRISVLKELSKALKKLPHPKYFDKYATEKTYRPLQIESDRASTHGIELPDRQERDDEDFVRRAEEVVSSHPRTVVNNELP